MKILISKLLFISAAIMLLASCKKDQATEYYEGGTAPVLTASVSNSIPLSNATKHNTAVTFSWTNPDYMFASGISSQNVTYLVEMDTLGANFTNPNKISYSISSDLGVAFLDSTLNADLANRLLLATGMQHTIQVRVTASMGTATATKLVSNVLQFTVTPWTPPPAVTPPSSGTLFLVGGTSIMNGTSWSNTNPFMAGYQFTQISTTEYKITVNLLGGDNTTDANQFLFVPVAGSWDHKYACSSISSQSTSGGSFGYDLSDNFPGPSDAGTYVIDVDFQHGTYTVTKQ